MTISQESLNKAQSIAAICGSVALPLAVAIVGWKVQTSISEEGLKKDYVQMATGILKDADKQKDEDLRKWAVAVLDSTAPVPFSQDLRHKLERGTVFFKVPMPPASFMVPPPELDKLNGKTGTDLLRNIITNTKKYHDVADQLVALQEWARIVADEPAVPKKAPPETQKAPSLEPR